MAKSLKELIEEGLVFPAFLPKKNDFLFNQKGIDKKEDLTKKGNEAINEFHHTAPVSEKLSLIDMSKLDSPEVRGYTLNLMGHDYGGKASAMWNSLYEACNIPLRNIMVVGVTEKVGEIISALRVDPKYLGGGASVGFKEIVLSHLDYLSPKDISSANAIVKKDGKLVGHNTDSWGLMRSLEEALETTRRTVNGNGFVVVGAGGVAKQFAKNLASKGAEYVIVVNRKIEKAIALAEQITREYPGVNCEARGETDLIDAILNQRRSPAAIVNTSDKGGDAFPNATMFWANTPDSLDRSLEVARTISRDNPEIIYLDIVLPKGRDPTSLQALREVGVSEKYLRDGRGMVFYQALPLLGEMRMANPAIYQDFRLSDKEVLKIFENSEK